MIGNQFNKKNHFSCSEDEERKKCFRLEALINCLFGGIVGVRPWGDGQIPAACLDGLQAQGIVWREKYADYFRNAMTLP